MGMILVKIQDGSCRHVEYWEIVADFAITGRA